MPKRMTTREKNKRIREWVSATFSGRTSTTIWNSIRLAEVATKELGFTVSPNRMCRELYKQNIKFKSHPDDPPRRTFTKVDLLEKKLEGVNKRLTELERKAIKFEELS